MAFNIHREKCQAETVKKALKNLLKSQWHMINIKFFNLHVSSLRMHPFDILDSEEKTEKKLINVNTAHQQFNKIAL